MRQLFLCLKQEIEGTLPVPSCGIALNFWGKYNKKQAIRYLHSSAAPISDYMVQLGYPGNYVA
jgi:hypothetical protein